MIKTKEELIEKLNGAVVRYRGESEKLQCIEIVKSLGFIEFMRNSSFKDKSEYFRLEGNRYYSSSDRHGNATVYATTFLSWFKQDRTSELVEYIAEHGCFGVRCDGAHSTNGFDGIKCPFNAKGDTCVAYKSTRSTSDKIRNQAKQWLINNPLEVDAKPDDKSITNGSPITTYIERAEANAEMIRERLGKASALLEFNDYSSIEKTEFNDGKFKVMGQSMSIDEARDLGEWLLKVTKKDVK